METKISQLNMQVMRRVKFIYWTKRVYHSVTLKLFLLGMTVVATTLYVSLPDIILNMPSLADIQSMWKFVFSAFANTGMKVQLLSLLSLSILFWLGRDIVRNIRESEDFATSQVRA